MLGDFQESQEDKGEAMVTSGFPQHVLRSTLRSLACPPCCLPPRLLRLQAGPLPSLRLFTVRRSLSTVTVRAQRTGLAEGKRAVQAASFAELGLGQDLLTFLAESRLGTPTEIQVRCCQAAPANVNATGKTAEKRHCALLLQARQLLDRPQMLLKQKHVCIACTAVTVRFDTVLVCRARPFRRCWRAAMSC